MMNLEIANSQRRAVISGNTVHLYRDNGIKRTHWISVWPPLKAENARPLKRWSKAWVEKGRLPKDLQ